MGSHLGQQDAPGLLGHPAPRDSGSQAQEHRTVGGFGPGQIRQSGQSRGRTGCKI